jgi:hypothetical protein
MVVSAVGHHLEDLMGLVGDIAGAFGLNFRDQLINGALRLVGIKGKANHAIRLAAELSKGITKDGFDLSKVNKGVVARNALKAFGVNSPIATLGLTAALKVIPKGFLKGAGAGGMGTVLAALGGTALAGTAAAGLASNKLGLGSLLAGALQPGQMAGTLFGLLAGDNKANVRSALGMQRANGGPGSMFAALPKPAFFEDIIAALMVDFVKDKQAEVEGKLKNLQKRSEKGKEAKNQAGGAATGLLRKVIPGVGRANDQATDGNSDSRNIEFEMIKNEVQKMSQMQQAMSNVLNTMHEQAMNAIRQIKAG